MGDKIISRTYIARYRMGASRKVYTDTLQATSLTDAGQQLKARLPNALELEVKLDWCMVELPDGRQVFRSAKDVVL